jgi:hypothetical protein
MIPVCCGDKQIEKMNDSGKEKVFNVGLYSYFTKRSVVSRIVCRPFGNRVDKNT